MTQINNLLPEVVAKSGGEIEKLQVIIRYSFGAKSKSCRGSLIDLARSTARISLAEPVPLHSTMEIQIQEECFELHDVILAEVNSVKPHDDNHWVLGCTLTNQIPDSAIAHLAATGYLERRKDKRHAVTVTAMVRCELSINQAVIVRVNNYSAGGFGMFSSQPFAVGERIMLEIGGIAAESFCFPAKVLWQEQSADGCMVGCNFISKDGTGQVAEIARAMQMQSAVDNPGERTSWLPLWLQAKGAFWLAKAHRHTSWARRRLSKAWLQGCKLLRQHQARL